MVSFIIKLPLVAGKDAVLVVCNKLFKIIYFGATIEEMSVEGFTRLFRDNVWKLHGSPESIVSDRGLQFVAKMTKKLNNILGIQMKLSTSFHL